MIFIDGVGIGKEDYQYNPFFKYGFKTFTSIFSSIPTLENQYLIADDIYLFPADARLGVDGLPQSGTGQAAIYCGMNAAKYVGKHFGPYPYSTLIPIIKEENIFLHYMKQDKAVCFANAYPDVFFEYIASGRGRLSTTSLICSLNGIKLNRVRDVRKGNALTAEITNERWNRKLGYSLPVIKPETAAKRLLKIASKNSFTLYEYFLTDNFGHGRNSDEMISCMASLDKFLYTILTLMDKENLTLIICSDHGNFEDLSIKTHTLNPSLAITAGKYGRQLSEEIKSLTDIKGAIIKFI